MNATRKKPAADTRSGIPAPQRLRFHAFSTLAERAGAFVTPTETVVFDWLERAESEAFKVISKLVR